MYSLTKFTSGINTRGNLYINPLGGFCYLFVEYLQKCNEIDFWCQIVQKVKSTKCRIHLFFNKLIFYTHTKSLQSFVLIKWRE